MTVHIRQGVYFSPPVNREVTSADVAYAIERGANPNVANGYFSAYFSHIVGASKATGGPIPGIVTPNRYTIVFHLTGPYGTFFARRAFAAVDRPGSQGVRRAAGRQEAHGVRLDIRGGDRSVHAEGKLEGDVPGDRLPTGPLGDPGAQSQLEPRHRPSPGLPQPDRHRHRRRSECDRSPGPGGVAHGSERRPGPPGDRAARLPALLQPASRLPGRWRRATWRSTTTKARSATSMPAARSGPLWTGTRWSPPTVDPSSARWGRTSSIPAPRAMSKLAAPRDRNSISTAIHPATWRWRGNT